MLFPGMEKYFFSGKNLTWLYNANFYEYNTDDGRYAVEYMLGRSKGIPISLDTETTGLNKMKDRIIGISLSVVLDNVIKSVWIPISEIDNLQSFLCRLFRTTVVMHNKKFDLCMIQNEGIDVDELGFTSVIVDTIILCYYMDPDGEVNLDYMTKKLLKRQTIKYSDLKTAFGGFIPAPKNIKKLYACQDSMNTLELYFWIEENRSDLLKNKAVIITNEVTDILRRMERRGIRVDVDFLKNAEKSLKKKLFSVEKEIYKLAGKRFNISSDDQVADVLFNKLRLPPTRLTGKKLRPSVAEKYLKPLKKKHKIVEKILYYSELDKACGTYAIGLQKHIVDGLVHTSYNPVRTGTTRLSSDEPNLQNLPKFGALNIRNAFIPRKDHYFIKADYSQIELRIFCYMAKITQAINIFESGGDIHAKMASWILKVPEKNVTEEQRKRIKTINFGIIYGMSEYGLAANLGISVAAAVGLLSDYFRILPGAKSYIESEIKIARKLGYVDLAYGGRRLVKGINSKVDKVRSYAERISVNTRIQGIAAEIMKIALIRCARYLKKISANIYLIATTHDDILFEVHNKISFKDATTILKKCMEFSINTKMLKMPCIPIDSEFGNKWGELKEVKKKKPNTNHNLSEFSRIVFKFNTLTEDDIVYLKRLQSFNNGCSVPGYLGYNGRLINLRCHYNNDSIIRIKKTLDCTVIGKK